MTVAELIQKLQSLNVDSDTPVNFLVNDVNAADVTNIKIDECTHVMHDGSWEVRKEINFNLYSDDVAELEKQY